MLVQRDSIVSITFSSAISPGDSVLCLDSSVLRKGLYGTAKTASTSSSVRPYENKSVNNSSQCVKQAYLCLGQKEDGKYERQQ